MTVRGRERKRPLKVLAVASGGGHWVELLRVMPAFAGAECVYVTVQRSYAVDVPGHRLHVISDATRWNKLALVRTAARLAWVLLRERPDVVITTGAAPGYFALRLAKRLGARTIWIDSIANVEEMSLSGQMVRRFADLWLTQWPGLARTSGAAYAGAVL